MSVIKVCAKCETDNLAGARYCLNCGSPLEQAAAWPERGSQRSETQEGSNALSKQQVAQQAPIRRPLASWGSEQPGAYAASSYAAKNYGAMRSIAELCRLVSYLIVAVAVLGMLAGVVGMLNSVMAGFALIVTSALFGAFSYIIFRLLGEGISVIIDIEANTRRTAQLLEKWGANKG